MGCNGILGFLLDLWVFQWILGDLKGKDGIWEDSRGLKGIDGDFKKFSAGFKRFKGLEWDWIWLKGV